MSTNEISIDIENQRKETCCDKFMTIAIIALLYFLGIGLIGACICYYVFGISYLVLYKKENDDCNSLIWTYVLSTLVSSLTLGLFSLNLKTEDASKFIINSASSLFSIGLGSWGLHLYLNENCNSLKETPLYTFNLVISLFQIITSGIVALYYIHLLCK